MKSAERIFLFFFGKLLLGQTLAHPSGNLAPYTDETNFIVDSFQDDLQLVQDGNGNFHLINVTALENEEFDAIPASRSETVVNFKLFTRKNSQGEYISPDDPLSLMNSNFNMFYPTRIITHGWFNNVDSELNQKLRAAYLSRGEFNVICVDWSSAALNLNYIYSKSRVIEVGVKLSSFIDFLHDYGGLRLSTLYLIGHSLGAHVSGIGGKTIKTGRVNTIIALDPASPLFSLNAADERIDEGDAEYVETIHTNGGMLGFHKPLGRASFYPNWGRQQLGCGLDPVGICSHGRSHEYFVESILETPNSFVAYHCDDFDSLLDKNCEPNVHQMVRMGGEPSNYGRNISGIFYVPTNHQSPFGVGFSKPYRKEGKVITN